jgi:glycerophosphoryl diester phosphodiesterase
MATLIQVRRGTTAQWVASSRVLAAGELGLDTDTGVLKVGNGTDLWADLPTTSAADVAVLEAYVDAGLLAKADAAAVTSALSGKVATTRTVNGHPLSADVTVTKSDVGLGSVDNTADSAKPISNAAQAALDGKSAISGFAADLPTPFYIAHRGASLVAPESSLTAYRVAHAQAADVLEQDVRTLADGVAAVMHDETVDRTTTGTGNVSDFSAVSWQKLVIDTAGLMGGTGWRTEYAPLFADIVREFGNRVTLAPQAYDDGALAGIEAAVSAAGVDRGTVIVQTNSLPTATAATALGYPVLVVTADLGADLNAIAATGAEYVAPPEAALTGLFVTNAHAAGLKVVPYSVNTKSRRDKLLALGVDGMFTDDPGYIKETIAETATDLFVTQATTSGFGKTSGTAGAFTAPDEFGWSNASLTAYRLGYMKPADASNYVLTYDVKLTSGESRVSVCNEDIYYNPGVGIETYDGYVFSLIASGGTLRLEDQVDGTRVNWLAFGTAITGFSAGSWITVELTVTPTTIKWRFPATGQTATYTNSVPGRPLPYIHIAGSAANVQYRNLVLS